MFLDKVVQAILELVAIFSLHAQNLHTVAGVGIWYLLTGTLPF